MSAEISPTASNSHLAYILELICNRLQITPTQHLLAEEKYKAVGNWLRAKESPLYRYEPTIYPQGSFRIGTTVRPIEHEEYDVDLVCHLLNDGSILDPMKLLNDVYERIVSNDMYKPPISEKKNRCVCINYKGNFHLDILPARSDPQVHKNHILVPDKKTQKWTASNPIGYAEWFKERAKVLIELLEKARIDPLPRYETLSDKLPLQQTVQLLKRWNRLVFKDNDDCLTPSIVLTTLAANKYNKELLITMALSNIVDGILEEARITSGPIIVLNPTNPKERLSEKWIENPDRYRSFIKALSQFKKEWDALFHVSGLHNIAAGLNRLFGEEVVRESVKDFGKATQANRKVEAIGINKSGMLTGLGAAITAIKPNTFYGA